MAKIEIDLADLGLSFDEDGEPTRNSLRDLVITQAVAKIVDLYRKDVTQAAELHLERIVDGEVTKLVEAVLTGPIQRRTKWGERIGEPTTVLEIAREKLQEFFDKPDNRDPYRREQAANLKGLVNDVVRQTLTEELKPAIAEARAAVTSAVRERLTSAVVNDLAKT